MNDLEKLRAILTELGVEPEKIELIIKAMSEDEAPVEEGKGEEPTTPEEEQVAVEEDAPNPPVEEAPVEGEGEVVPTQEDVPADPESVPPALAEEQVPPVEEVPAVPPTPELPPMVSLEEFNQVKSELEETKKALDGVVAKCDSLVEALQGAGVISGAAAVSVGHDQPSVPSSIRSNDTMDSVLAEINRKGY